MPSFHALNRLPQPESPFRNDDEKIDWILHRLKDPTVPLPSARSQPQALPPIGPRGLREAADQIARGLERERLLGTGPDLLPSSWTNSQLTALPNLTTMQRVNESANLGQNAQAGGELPPPSYDASDDVLLEPGNSQPARLRCQFGQGQFSASITVINEDRGSMGDAIRMFRGTPSTNPVRVVYRGDIADAVGSRQIPPAVISAQLPVGAWRSTPLARDISGPGRLAVEVTNQSPHYTAIVLGVMRTTTS